MEYQRTWLRDLKYVLSFVESEWFTEPLGQKVPLHELMAKLRQRQASRSQRAVSRALIVVERIVEHFAETSIKRSRLETFLRTKIAEAQEGFLEVDLYREGGDMTTVETSDRTQCDLPKTGACTCRREEAQCNLPSFLAQHASVLAKVRRAFEPGQDSKMVEAVERILDREEPTDWAHAKGQKNCWPLGDTIIALEAPEDAAIYTTDRHYEVICPIVGRELFEETPKSASKAPGVPSPR